MLDRSETLLDGPPGGGNTSSRDEESDRARLVANAAVGMVHDFRNMISVVLLTAETLRSSVEAGSTGAYVEMTEALSDIALAAQGAHELCEQLLRFHKGDSKVVSEVDLAVVVASSTRLLRATIHPAVTLDTSGLRAGLGTVRANPIELQRVLLNLVINASEAMGGRTGTISLRTLLASDSWRPPASAPRYDATWLALEVADDGPGLPTTCDELATPSTKGAGRGFGLGIVESIVTGLGGFVRVVSLPGRGSAFRVLLPAVQFETSANR